MGVSGEAHQERLFGEMPGEVSPPDPNLYLGTSGWSYADWEGTIYRPGIPAGARLAEYVRRYATVEIDSTFYGTPKRSTVERWRELAPNGFLFAAKFPREITHERTLVGCTGAARTFVETMSGLGDRLGPLLVQLPPSFGVEGLGILEEFLDGLPQGPRYAVEVRHRSWLRSDLPEMLREKRAALALIDYPGMPRLEEATTSFSYIRWLGDRREFPASHTHSKRDRVDDLSWWAGVVDALLSRKMTVFAYANNHYENHSPSTLARFLQLWRDRR